MKTFASLVLLLLSTAAHAETTRYVTDQLEITMRSGQSTKHQIVRMLPSGNSLEVIEVDDETKYTRVRTADGEEGWVLSRYLDDIPSARERLTRATDLFESTKEKNTQLAKTVSDLRKEKAALASELKTLQDISKQQETDLNHIKRVSANAIAIDNKNQSLTTQLQQLQSDYDNAQQLASNLQNASDRDWFIVGAGIILLGILIGLIIPKIHWKKKSAWGTL